MKNQEDKTEKLENNLIKLTPDHQILLYSFLTDVKAEGEPKNFIEWGEEWLLICSLAENIPNIIVRNILIINDDCYFAVFNWLATYVSEIKTEQKGEQKFKDYSSLFIYLKDFYELKHPDRTIYSPYIYIPKFYVDEKPIKKVYVNPNSNVEDVLNNL